ncbi:MAG: Crp/Fnr family transcriptional regulator [Campylobacterales bacterium]|nr:Crp/Fnr family transcriptional regulator [Campylobacterales bacterium]
MKSYPPGNILFYAGERPRRLHLIKSGVVRVVKHDTAGNEIVLAHFRADDLVAEAAHFENIPYPATAHCVTDVTLYEIDFEAFKSRLLSRPDVALGIIHSLTRKIKRLDTVIHRSQIGLTPETVSRILRRFKALGWV